MNCVFLYLWSIFLIHSPILLVVTQLISTSKLIILYLRYKYDKQMRVREATILKIKEEENSLACEVAITSSIPYFNTLPT